MIVCLSIVIFFVVVQSIWYFYMWKRTEKALKAEIKHSYEIRFNHIKYVRLKIKAMKLFGIKSPLEELALKYYEKVVLESYERDYEYISGEKIKIPT